MAITSNDYFLKVGQPGTATTLSAPGYTSGGTTINVASTGNFPNDTAVIFGIDTVSLSSGTQVRNANSYCVFVGIVTSATSIGSVTLLSGTPQNYAAAATTRVYITVSSVHTNRLISGILQHANQDGSLKTTAVQTALGLGTSSLNGWNVLGATPSSVTANGNRSYTVTFNGSDQTGTLSPGMRLRTTRTVAAPTQCTSLNGTTQFYSKTSPAGMTFTNNFVVGAAVKPSAYQLGTINSRYNGTSGWALRQLATGQIELTAYNAGAANFFKVTSYQSVSLNKFVNNVAVQVDMTVTTNTPTTNYVMIDGVDVPAFCTRGGTNPTALVQAGNYEIGSDNGGLNPYAGKIAQEFVYSAKVTQATILAASAQGLLGTETNLVSAHSFNNTVNDLNTTNANNLTANGSAVATNADSPFGGQAGGAISSTLDYGIVESITFSTNTTVVVRTSDICTIPTSGGVAAVAYSTNANAYGLPGDLGSTIGRQLVQVINNSSTAFGTSATTLPSVSGISVLVPSYCTRLKIYVDFPAVTNTNGSTNSLTIYNGSVATANMVHQLNQANGPSMVYAHTFSVVPGSTASIIIQGSTTVGTITLSSTNSGSPTEQGIRIETA